MIDMRARAVWALLAVAVLGGSSAGASPVATRLTARPVIATVSTGGTLLNVGFSSVSAKLIESETDAPLEGKTVIFTADGSTLCRAVTNVYGLASCGLDAHVGALVAQGYEASFDGDDSHTGSSDRGPLFRVSDGDFPE
ncbi:MAG TPA: hypothetical protein VGB52_14920 [Actinomycetota bacterium]